MSFIASLVFIILLQLVLQIVLQFIGITGLIAEIIINLVLAIVFTYFLFSVREKLKNPEFHKAFAIYFVVLMLFTLLFMLF